MAESLDLVGKRFGYLTVIARTDNTNRGNTRWICLCDCGKTKVALGYDLSKGRTTTCGCKMNLSGKPSHNREDLVGMRFGKLTVVSLNEERGKLGALRWNCLCDCGNTVVVQGSNLKSGKKKHCGCDKNEFSNNFVDITGKRYGRLTVVKLFSHDSPGEIKWLCKCDCGNEKIVDGRNLHSGNTKSCGCLLRESRLRNATKKALKNRKDLPTDPDTYRLIRSAYGSMHHRCSEKYHSSKAYFLRGIRVCDEWKNFDAFLKWSLENGFQRGLSLDRIDVNGIYEPSNCRWVTDKEQQNNKTNNVYITIDGETKTMKQWAEHFGVSYPMVKARRKYGWPKERWFEPNNHKE